MLWADSAQLFFQGSSVLWNGGCLANKHCSVNKSYDSGRIPWENSPTNRHKVYIQKGSLNPAGAPEIREFSFPFSRSPGLALWQRSLDPAATMCLEWLWKDSQEKTCGKLYRKNHKQWSTNPQLEKWRPCYTAVRCAHDRTILEILESFGRKDEHKEHLRKALGIHPPGSFNSGWVLRRLLASKRLHGTATCTSMCKARPFALFRLSRAVCDCVTNGLPACPNHCTVTHFLRCIQ